MSGKEQEMAAKFREYADNVTTIITKASRATNRQEIRRLERELDRVEASYARYLSKMLMPDEEPVSSLAELEFLLAQRDRA